MKKYNFDEVIDRHGTDAVKITVIEKQWKRTDLLPLWVADMDFRTAPCVTEAIRHRLENGIFGYTSTPRSYYDAIVRWCRHRYDWEIPAKAIDFIPGIVPGLGMAMECFSSPGDKVLIQPPVYHPFRNVTEKKGRQVVNNPLIFKDGCYYMDFDDLDRKLEGCRIMILCNPHNPGGCVWSADDLRRVAALCAKHNVLVISDEIHADLTFAPLRHTPFASVSDEAARNSVTFMAPSKAFNMPGLVCSQSIILDLELRKRFKDYLEAGDLNMGHVFSYLGVQTAYNEGEPWLIEVLEYIQENIRYVDEFLRRYTPKICAVLPQASFLVFLDCRELGLSQSDLVRFFIEKARLALNDGTMFGAEGAGFMRMNVAVPRTVLEEAMNRLREAYEEVQSGK